MNVPRKQTCIIKNCVIAVFISMMKHPLKERNSLLPNKKKRPYLKPADLSTCLPPFVTAALRHALQAFDKSMPGFAGRDAILVGVESRVSAPVRIARSEAGESTSVRGLYPVGEGAGYAGGITSAAVDGMRAAEAVLQELTPAG